MKQLILFIYALSSSLCMAQTQFSPGSPTPQVPATSTSSPTSTASSGAATHDGSGSTGSSKPSINSAAQQGQQSQGAGAAANILSGGLLMASAVPMLQDPSPTRKAMGAALMAMSILAMVQGSQDAGAAAQSGDTYGSSLDGSTSGLDYSALNGASPASQAAFADQQVAAANDALKSAGFSVQSDGLHSPDGTVTPMSSFSSPSAMTQAGIDAGTVAAAQGILSQAASAIDGSKPRVSTVAINTEGGGKGKGGDEAGDGSGGGSSPFSFGSPFRLNDKSKRQMVAGKTVLFDGEPIGVRGQNIFDMIHTCYDRKRTHNTFIEAAQPAPAATLRAPASVPKKTGG